MDINKLLHEHRLFWESIPLEFINWLKGFKFSHKYHCSLWSSLSQSYWMRLWLNSPHNGSILFQKLNVVGFLFPILQTPCSKKDKEQQTKSIQNMHLMLITATELWLGMSKTPHHPFNLFVGFALFSSWVRVSDQWLF